MREKEVEYLDELPDGYVLSLAGNSLEFLGVPSIKRRWRLKSGLQGFDVYVPEWGRRVVEAFLADDAAHIKALQRIRDDVVKKLVAVDDETRNAAMTVFDLGGIDALVLHVLKVDMFLALASDSDIY